MEHESNMPEILVVADQRLKGFLQSSDPNPLACVMQSHHASGNTLEETTQSQRKTKGRVRYDSLLYLGASLVLQNAFQFCAILQVFYHKDALFFFAGDGSKTAHIDGHSILYFELHAFQAFSALPFLRP